LLPFWDDWLCVLFSIYWWVARCLEEISYEQK
jgi:hypothetical protein